MRVFKLFRGAAVVLATVGTVVPMNSVSATETPTKAVRPAAPTVAADIKKSPDGRLAGRVVDSTGVAIENANVVVRQGSSEIVRGRTDHEGMFSINKLKAGTYQVSSGTTEGLFRIWNDKDAPPSARSNALLVVGQNGERGQYGGMNGGGPGGFSLFNPTTLLMAAGIAGAGVASGIAISKADALKSTTTAVVTVVSP